MKNRLHIDLAPSPDAGQEAEVRRLEDRGARRVGIGQDPEQVSWVVMADPEGNEFCVLSEVSASGGRPGTTRTDPPGSVQARGPVTQGAGEIGRERGGIVCSQGGERDPDPRWRGDAEALPGGDRPARLG